MAWYMYEQMACAEFICHNKTILPSEGHPGVPCGTGVTPPARYLSVTSLHILYRCRYLFYIIYLLSMRTP